MDLLESFYLSDYSQARRLILAGLLPAAQGQGAGAPAALAG
jgi:hypothetical protein